MRTLTAVLALVLILTTAAVAVPFSASAAVPSARFWPVQAVDEMKFSRDTARTLAKQAGFDAVIERHVSSIADVGATHIAIGTPYDDEFLPLLKRWVASARAHGLGVWFRGNFSGWEGWFEYEPITRFEHMQLTEDFILKHADLFADGDVFTACPECENGSVGDPRFTGEVDQFRQFLKDEYWVTDHAFGKIGKRVISNYHAMNGDVARLIMDQETTEALGGIVAVDHYVKTPKQLAADIRALAAQSGGAVVLSEFGAPIPDIHGKQTESQQAAWLREVFAELVKIPELVAVNYWVGHGGSTAIWRDDGAPRAAAAVIQEYYRPSALTGTVTDELDRPVPEVQVKTELRSVQPDETGQFAVPVLTPPNQPRLTITAPGYFEQEFVITSPDNALAIALKREHAPWWFRAIQAVRGWLQKIFSRD